MCGRRTGTSEQAAQKLTGRQDGEYAEKGGARHKKSGEQAAKNISAHVQQRTCVVGEGGSSRKAKSQATCACRSMDAFLIKQMTETAGKSKTHSSPLLALCQKSGKKVTKKLQKIMSKKDAKTEAPYV